MWWYWAVDVLVWVAGLGLFWKAVDNWRGNNKLKLPDETKKLACKK